MDIILKHRQNLNIRSEVSSLLQVKSVVLSTKVLSVSPQNATLGLFVGWLLNVPATCERISGTDLLNYACCHTEIEVADQTFHLTQSQ